MHKQVLFSVIMPVYNRAHVVLRAVNSVLSQTCSDFELIIVDDASTDNTVEIIETIQDERIVLIKRKQNSGAAEARNIGIEQARGKYICFLDSDDSFESNYLEEALNMLKESTDDIGFVWCGTRYHESLNGECKISERIWKPAIINTPYETFLKNLHIGIGCGVTFKREVFDKVGLFNTILPAAEDTDFFFRAAKHYSFRVIEKVLVNIYKTGSDRMSTRFNKLNEAYGVFLPQHFDFIEKDKELRLKYYYKLCWLSYYSHDKRQARNYFRKVLKDSPFHTKAWVVRFLFEVLGERTGSKIHRRISKVI